MAFWGVEVKSGPEFEVSVGKGMLLRLDKASLGDGYHNEQESVSIHIVVDGEDYVLGTLDTRSQPTEMFNQVFYKNFKVYHTMENASLYLFGRVFKKREKKETTTKKEEGSKAMMKSKRASKERRRK